MEGNHLVKFSVQNFKCHSSLEMDGIGQFNLITGDNNSGKSSLLEALCLNDANKPNELYRIRFVFEKLLIDFRKFPIYRQPAFDYFLGEKDNFISVEEEYKIGNYRLIKVSHTEINGYLSFKLEHSTQKNAPLGFTNPRFYDEEEIKQSRIFPNLEYQFYLPLVSTHDSAFEDLINSYSYYIEDNKQALSLFINGLKKIIPGIEDLRISKESSGEIVLKIVQKDFSKNHLFQQLGDGAKFLFKILLNIARNKNGRLMIDEIDSGIHFKRLKFFWKAIIEMAKQMNVQLFATTHSLECLKTFKEAIEEFDDIQLSNSTKLFILRKGIESKTIAHKIDFDGFAHAIDNENEIRL
jgi:AAA15 family ATPase/GTPase